MKASGCSPNPQHPAIETSQLSSTGQVGPPMNGLRQIAFPLVSEFH